MTTNTMPVPSDSSASPAEDTLTEERSQLAERIQTGLEDQLLPELVRLAAAGVANGSLRTQLREEALRHCNPSERIFSAAERVAIAERAVDTLLGWGPLVCLWRDPAIEEILINGSHETFVDRHGRLERADVPVQDDASLRRLAAQLCARAGLAFDPLASQFDVTLPDGAQMHAVLAPYASSGVMLSLRRATARMGSIQDLLQHGVAAPEMIEFLTACIKSRMNLVIAGPAGCGKTALLGTLARQIPTEERVATIEHSPELHLPNIRTLSFVAVPSVGRPPATVRDLLRGALAMRPDRLILGECRGGETGDFLDALAAGRDGAMTTIEAPTVRDALARLEMLALRSNPGTPPAAVRRQITTNVSLVVLLGRSRGGARRVTAIHEVTGMEGEVLASLELFRLQPGSAGQAGHFECCGNTPNCLERLRGTGITLPSAFFQRRQLALAVEQQHLGALR